ncbi:MAG: DUF2723 domain-containing protein [Candidatus Omnitrophota bacterium]
MKQSRRFRNQNSVLSSTLIQLKDYIAIAVLFLVSFIVYIKTLCPTVYEGDSGEILSAIATLGVAHSTGFPLYILLSKLFTLILPFGDIAYRVNILSAVFASLSVGVVYLILRTLERSRPACIGAALSFAFSATLWSHATAARVYSMTGFFIALLVWIIFLWRKNPQDKYLLIFAVALGLGLGTHIMMVLVIPVAVAAVIITDPKTFLRPRFIWAVFIAVILGGLQYLYIPIAAANNAVVNWGNPVDLPGFINYITQKDFSFKMAARTIPDSMAALFEIIKLFVLEFTFLGFVLIFGFIGYWGKYKKVFLLASLLIIGNVLLMMNYGNEDDRFILYRYFLPSYIVMTIWIGYAFDFFRDYLKNRQRLVLFSFLPLIFLPLICLAFNYHKNDRSGNFIVYDYAANILNTVPEGSLLFSTGDAVSGPLLYLQVAKNYKKGVIFIEAKMLTWDWYCKNLLKRYKELIPGEILSVPPQQRVGYLIDAHISKRPVFSTFLMLEKYEYIPYGLVNKITMPGLSPEAEEVKEINDSLWQVYNMRGLLDAGIYKDYMVKEIVRLYSKSLNNLGLYYSKYEMVEDTIKEYEESLKYNPDNFAVLLNLGQLYLKRQENDKADLYLKKAREVNPGFFHEEPRRAEALPDYKITLNIPEVSEGEESPEYHIQRGANFGMMGEHDKAIDEFKKALSLDPEFSIAYVNLGNAYMNKDSVDEAIDMYKQAIKINPGIESSIAYLNLGAIYVNIKKDFPNAATYLEKYVELNPDDTQSKMIKEQIQQLKYIVSQAEQK